MDLKVASKHQKRKFIEDGQYIDQLVNDDSRWIQIRAKQKRIELKQQQKQQQKDDNLKKLMASQEPDLFEVIVLSSKSTSEMLTMISENKFLPYFARHDKMGIRLRAKRQLKHFLKEREQVDYEW